MSVSVNLTTWSPETYLYEEGHDGDPFPIWEVQADDPSSVFQTQNSFPSLFCSDFQATGLALQGNIQVETSLDDDYIGFALGFSPGDSQNANASYILVDWKKSYQLGGNKGLAISSVNGVPGTVDDWWSHSGSIVEIARGATLGSTGWQSFQGYDFQFDVTPTVLDVYINGGLEISITGSFEDLLSGSRFCFFNFSQENVKYTGIRSQIIPTGEPSSSPTISEAPSKEPSVVPSTAPSCFPGKFTDECLPLIYLTSLFPSKGSQGGGFLVRAQGYNMNDGSVVCHFGPDYNVPGVFISDSEVSCVAPEYALTSNFNEGLETVEFSLSIGDESSINSLQFEFYGECPTSRCQNGYCAGGECFCDLGFRGEACDESIVAPQIGALEDQEAVAGSLFELVPVLEAGTAPVSWSVTTSPFEPGLSIASATGTVSLLASDPRLLHVTLRAENEGYSSSTGFNINILPSYYLDSIVVQPTELLSGSDNPIVYIEGTCIEFATGSPRSFCDAEVVVEHDGFRRVHNTVGGQDGFFTVPFKPFESEGGNYSVIGQVPGTTSNAIDALFSISGMFVSPGEVTVRGLTSGESNATATIAILHPNVVMSGVSVQAVDDIPPEILGFQLLLGSSELDSSTPSSTLVAVVEGASAPVSAMIEFKVSATNSLAIAYGKVRVDIQSPTARLSARPDSLNLRCNRGQRSRALIVVINEGAATSGQLQVVTAADFRLLRIASGNVIPPLQPGEASTITFECIPEPEEPFNIWSGNFKIASSGLESDLVLDFELEVSSIYAGSIRVLVEDEYTFHAEGEPKVSSALVSLRNLVTDEMLSNVSDANGEALFPNVDYGSYQLMASAVNHSTHYRVVTVESPKETLVYAFLALELVSYTWTVDTVSIEEEYAIEIEATFTAYVPAPVIVVEPTQINTLTLRPGVDEINFVITNYGLITANNFEINLPPTSGLMFEPLLDGPIGDIPGNTTMYYPVKVEEEIKGGGDKHRSASGCVSGTYLYSIPCRGNEWYSGIIAFVGGGSSCAVPDFSGGGVKGDGSCCSHGVRRSPQFYIFCGCQGVPKATIDCAVSLLNLPSIAKCLYANYNCFKLMRSGASTSSILTCHLKLHITCSGIAVPPVIKVWLCALNLLKACFGGTGAERRNLQVELEDQIAAENLQESFAVLELIRDVAFHAYGGYEAWTNMSQNQIEVLGSRLDMVVADDSEHETYVSESELLFLTNYPLENVSDPIGDLVVRWNISLGYYERGIFSASDVPPNEDPEMIDLMFLNESQQVIQQANNEAQLRGFEDFGARLLADRDAFIVALDRTRSGVCAKVRIQINQRAILVREAFQAELQVENGGDEMTNIEINIVIRKGDSGELSTHLFLIDDPDLVGISGVGGMGSLAADTSGSVSWLFLALGEAAPAEDPVQYEVGGVFSYLLNGINNTVTLYPETISVSPDPQLELVYFHEYDIYGDDPFTPEVEPAVPYELAVLVKNVGFGDAIGFRVQSGQPTIIENDKGLLVDFEIVSSKVNGEPAEPSLLVDFGTLAANTCAVGVWKMVSSLQGFFSDYNATFTYKGPIQDDRLALVQSVDIFELSHSVFIDTDHATRGGGVSDHLPDFLVNKLPDIDRLPDTLVSSDFGVESPVFISLVGEVLVLEATPNEEAYDWRLVIRMDLPFVPNEVASPNGDWYYFRLEDPLSNAADYILQSVIKSATGTELRLDSNVWHTAKTKRYVGMGPVEERYWHIFDFASPTGVFELRFATAASASNLVAVQSTNSSVLLTWSLPPSGSDGQLRFRVLQKYQSLPDSSFVQIASQIYSSQLTAFDLLPGHAYTFRLVTDNQNGQFSTVLEAHLTMSGEAPGACGNGMVDDMEECDDGNKEDGDCCSSTCQLEAAGSVCRAASGDCDVPDVCDGLSPVCGENLLAVVGTTCGTADGECELSCTGLSTVCPTVCETEAPSTYPSSRPSGLPSVLPSTVPTESPFVCPCNQSWYFLRWLCRFLMCRGEMGYGAFLV